jgi:hypothetical protein
VFGDPLTAGLKPISNGETSAQRGMRNEVPQYGVLGRVPTGEALALYLKGDFAGTTG